MRESTWWAVVVLSVVVGIAGAFALNSLLPLLPEAGAQLMVHVVVGLAAVLLAAAGVVLAAAFVWAFFAFFGAVQELVRPR